jgi:membrane protease YdiL (CAAX protease family)
MLALLIAMVLLPFLLPWILQTSDGSSPAATALPGDTAGMLLAVAENIGVSGLLLGLAFWVGKPSASELWIRRQNPLVAGAFAIGWSVALRIGLGMILLTIVGVYTVKNGHDRTEEMVKHLRPDVEKLLPFAALHDPVYALILVTVVSFVLAGFREELWRAGVLAVLLSLFQNGRRTRPALFTAVIVSSLIFGAAHATQGVGGMLIAGVLGLGLGAIMIGHRSFWIAAAAHGLFDATSFTLIWALVHFNLTKLLTG